MDFSFSESDLAYRDRLRSWLASELDPEWRAGVRHGSPEYMAFGKEWERTLFRAGWGGVFWPAEFGGSGATTSEKIIYAKTMAEAGAPEGLGKIGKRLVGPMLMQFGSPALQEAHLPRILRGEEFFCQGFSEPDAGSDLAALRCRAEVRGDEVIVTGEKVWTSFAQFFDWCLVIVRTATSEKKQDGLSLLLVELDAPGVDIRPLRQINRQSDFASVHFDDVRVPAGNLVGPLHEGWRIVRSVLAHERGVEQAFSRYVDARVGAGELLAKLRRLPREEQLLHAAAVGSMEMELIGGPLNALRLLSAQLRGHAPNDMTSVLKLQHSEAWSRGSLERLALLACDPDSQEDSEPAYLDYLDARAVTIAGGTSEIQRDVIARRALGA